MIPKFASMGKIPRLSRELWTVTEKIDGTNAGIYVDSAQGIVQAASRNRWIMPGDDNYGFAAWVANHREELLGLGDGMHWGEWWGTGIQHGYNMGRDAQGQPKRYFSLFNVYKWRSEYNQKAFDELAPAIATYGNLADHLKPMLEYYNRHSKVIPGCCNVVPVLYIGCRPGALTQCVDTLLHSLNIYGSVAPTSVLGEDDTRPAVKAEGVVAHGWVSNTLYKKTFNDVPKGAVVDAASA